MEVSTNTSATTIELPTLRIATTKNNRHYCHCLNFGIASKGCQDLSKQLDNQLICLEKNCQSLWKFCPFCVIEKIVGRISLEESLVENRGLCYFHNEHGPISRRFQPLIISKEILKKFPDALLERFFPEIISEKEVIPKQKEEASLTESPKRGRKEKPISEAIKMRQQVFSPDKIIGLREVLVSEIKPFSDQPRFWFNEESLKLLSESLAGGQTQTITLMEINDNEYKYELVDGERRWRSAKKAGLKSLLAVLLKNMDEGEQFLRAAMANFGGEQHCELEEIELIRKLRLKYKLTAKQISVFLVKTLSWVNQRMPALSLEQEVLDMMHPEHKDKRLLISHARALSHIKDKEKQVEYAKKIFDGRVRAKQVWMDIRKLASSQGNRAGGKRTPRDDLKILLNSLNRFQRELASFLDMSDDDFSKMFASSSGASKRPAIQKQIENISENLSTLIKNLF